MVRGFLQYSMQRCRFMLFIIGLLGLISLYGLSSTARAADLAENNLCPAKIDHIEAAKSDVSNPMTPPAQGWIKLNKVPDQWENRWPDYHGNAWYKITVNYPCSPTAATSQPLTFAIEGITQSGRVYINNALLWQDDITANYSSRSQHQPRLWNIPASSLKQGENIILIQVYGSLTQKSGIGKVEVGTYTNVNDAFKTWLLEKRTLIELNTMINLVVAIFFLLAWIAIRNEKAFLWMAITGISWVIYSTCVIYSDPITWLTTVQLDRLQNIVFCFYTVFGCIGAWYFAHHPFPRIQNTLLAIATIASISIAFAPEQYLNQTIQIFFSFFVLVFAIKCFTYPFLAHKVKMPETYLLAVMYVIYLPIAIHDAHFMITMEGRAWSPYTGPLTTMALGGILSLRLARHTRQIERFNKTLTENVQRAEHKLTTSLGQQHQLALENARLQERIHLSHDLHDGLGGSIVRSILTLEHNEKIEKTQVMSILKMLRSDLRQVIDSGSSISSKAPDTPIEWAAPIRHRFVQLFEEIDIVSEWHFHKTWHNQPNALHCITLTRVSEEALTNILKHSQATHVRVTLHEHEDELILEIQDNGVGFDPSTVESGLHVGLQSMCARIERLGGKFQVESQMGCTLIRVILPAKANAQDTSA